MEDLALQIIQDNIRRHQNGEDATYLDLGCCGLTHLPEEIAQCPWVETLILSNGWREYNPHTGVWELKTSQNLGKTNRITSIEGIEYLKNLKALHTGQVWSKLGSNQWKLNDLSSLARCLQLQMLVCSDTQVSDLTPLSGLTALQVLDCSRTQVKALRPLAHLTKLKWFNADNCPIEDCPADVWQTERGALLRQYFHSIANQEAHSSALCNAKLDNRRDVKFILLGNSNTGKTSLHNYLVTGPIQAWPARQHPRAGGISLAA